MATPPAPHLRRRRCRPCGDRADGGPGGAGPRDPPAALPDDPSLRRAPGPRGERHPPPDRDEPRRVCEGAARGPRDRDRDGSGGPCHRRRPRVRRRPVPREPVRHLDGRQPREPRGRGAARPQGQGRAGPRERLLRGRGSAGGLCPRRQCGTDGRPNREPLRGHRPGGPAPGARPRAEPRGRVDRPPAPPVPVQAPRRDGAALAPDRRRRPHGVEAARVPSVVPLEDDLHDEAADPGDARPRGARLDGRAVLRARRVRAGGRGRRAGGLTMETMAARGGFTARLPVWRRLGFRLGASFLALTALAVLLSGLLQYRAEAQSLRQSLGTLLLNIARTGALLVDGDTHETVVATGTAAARSSPPSTWTTGSTCTWLGSPRCGAASTSTPSRARSSRSWPAWSSPGG